MRLIAVLFLFAASAMAGPVFESGPAQVPLLELYTSEGCSSCPPADAWFTARGDDTGLWKSFVPVAFHVDYWNNLGWPDRFASSVFTDRQRKYEAEGILGSVYTPAVVYAGREWRFGGEFPSTNSAEPGTLRLAVDNDASQVRVSFQPSTELPDGLTVRLAALGANQHTQVRNGENAGRLLRHDFVALNLQSSSLTPASDGTLTATFSLPSTADALAAWVESSGSSAPLQAVGGWLDKSP